MKIADLFVKLGLKKDEFDKGINNAKQQVGGFGGMVSKVGGLLSAAFVATGIIAFAKSAIDSYNKVAQANAKMNAVIKATGGVAGVSATYVKQLTGELKRITLYSGTELTNAAAVLLTFPKVTKDIFKDALTQAANMSAVLGGDLQSSIIQIGKALNSPQIGLTALRRSGVSFTEQQVAMIKSLVASGKQLEAQKIILQELNTEFGGAAQSIAKSGIGAWTMLQKEVKAVTVAFGEAIAESKIFKDVLSTLGNAAVGIKKLLSGSTIDASMDGAKDWASEFVKTLPKDMGEAKSAIKNEMDALQILIDDYAAAIKKETSGVFNNIQLFNPYSGQAKSVDALRKNLQLYENQFLLLQKALVELKPFVKREDLTLQQQYNLAIDDFNARISEAKEAARQADPGLPFIEATKAVAELKKELEDFIKTYAKIPQRPLPIAPMTGGRGVEFGETPSDYFPTTLTNGKFENFIADDFFKPDNALKGIDRFFKELRKRIKEQQDIVDKDWKNFNAEFKISIENGLGSVGASLFAGIGELVAGATTSEDFGKNILLTVGNFMQQLGELFLTMGIHMALANAAIKLGPIGAPLLIAAGAGLIAAGAAISGLTSKGLSGSSTSSASGYSSSGYSGASASQTLQGSVTFELQGNKLAGVLNNTNERNRLMRG